MSHPSAKIIERVPSGPPQRIRPDPARTRSDFKVINSLGLPRPVDSPRLGGARGSREPEASLRLPSTILGPLGLEEIGGLPAPRVAPVPGSLQDSQPRQDVVGPVYRIVERHPTGVGRLPVRRVPGSRLERGTRIAAERLLRNSLLSSRDESSDLG